MATTAIFRCFQVFLQLCSVSCKEGYDAVYWIRGLTLAKRTEKALDKAILSLEKASIIYDDKTVTPLKNKGEEFPERDEELKSGRPVR
ncbi:hypothetical protein N9Y92_04215 [Chlamydiales bacterium]|nr:hypothetical protein [Chlamydiales bacterium]